MSENNMSIFHLIGDASLTVKGVMSILFIMLVYAGFLICKKYIFLKLATRSADYFEQQFWSGADISHLYQIAKQKGQDTEGLEAIFLSGFQEFLRLSHQPLHDPEFVVSNANRAMRATLSREVEELEAHLAWLATTGAVSPYFGLFGTVWGVMSSFQALGAVKQVTLAQVAPGISEALVATALGLMTAIPSVMAYNRFVYNTEKLTLRYENFIDEFSNILARQYSHIKQQGA